MDVQLVVERFKVGLPPCADAQLVALLSRRAAAAPCLLSTLVVFLRRVDTRCHCPPPSWEKEVEFQMPF